MGGRVHRTMYLRFALLSLAAVALAAGAYAFVEPNAAAGRERDAASRSAAVLVAEPLRSLFNPVDKTAPLPDALRTAADGLAFTLGSGGVRGISVSSGAGVIIYEGGARFPALSSHPGEGAVASADVRSPDGTPFFVTQLGAEGYTIEVAQDAAPLADAIASTRLELIATVIAFAIGVWLLMQGVFWFGNRSLIREHGQLTRLYDAGEALRSSMDLHDVLTQLAQDAVRLGNGAYGLVALFDEATSEVILRATYDRATGDVSMHQRAIDEWFIRRCVATNASVVGTLSEGGVRQYFGAGADVGREVPLLCAPMAIGDRVVGAIAIVGATSGRGGFLPADVRLVEQLAGQAVSVVEQSILLAKVRSDANAIEESYDLTLKALMAALDAKDRVTEGHSERVVKVTMQLCRQMELPESMMVHIERGAMLHDVGEIGVPDAILKKPAALSAGEWQTMRKHPMLAGLMVSKIGFLEPALPILLYHHEKYDGTGYPLGLAGGNIPIEARIFAIADAYDAMTQDRPYRDAMPHHEAMDEIRRHDGTQFDPEVVAAFAQLMAARPDLHGGSGSGHRVLGMHDLEGHGEERVA